MPDSKGNRKKFEKRGSEEVVKGVKLNSEGENLTARGREIARKMDLPKSTAYRYRRLAQNPSAAANC